MNKIRDCLASSPKVRRQQIQTSEQANKIKLNLKNCKLQNVLPKEKQPGNREQCKKLLT